MAHCGPFYLQELGKCELFTHIMKWVVLHTSFVKSIMPLSDFKSLKFQNCTHFSIYMILVRQLKNSWWLASQQKIHKLFTKLMNFLILMLQKNYGVSTFIKLLILYMKVTNTINLSFINLKSTASKLFRSNEWLPREHSSWAVPLL